jgi:hypothetical protein
MDLKTEIKKQKLNCDVDEIVKKLTKSEKCVVCNKVTTHKDGKLPSYVLYRPKGACGCNISCKQSNEGEVGMPSIHSIISGYYSALYNKHLFVIVALSRLGKAENPLFYHSKSGCHTLPQVIIGYLIGYILKTKLIG